MLDDRSCLVSGAVPRVCEQEGKWVYMRYSFIEVPNGKRRLEDDDEVDVFGMRKSLKRLQQKHGADGISPTLHNLFPARPEDGLNQQSYDRDQFGMNCDFTWLVEGRELNLSKRLDDLELSLSNMKERRACVNGELSLGDEKEDLGWKRTTAQLLELHEKDLTLTMNDLHLSSSNRSDKKYHNRNRVDAKGKRPVENGRRETLLSKQSDMTEKEEMTLSLNDLRLSPADQSDQQFHFGYQMDMKGKRRLEGGEEELLGKRKSSKRLDLHVRDEVTHVLHDLALSSVEPLDQEDSERDQADTSSLIQFLGRDISIHCLLRCSRSDYNLLASLNRSFRNLIRTGELYKLRRKVAIVEHWVYFSCDVHKWEAFDPIRRRWMHLPRMPSNDCFSCSDKESLAVGTELLVFGKEITSHVIWKYSILSNSWSSGMVMNAPRCLFGSASLGEIAILAGGCDSKGKVLSSAELYNSETGTWEILPSMKKPRKMCSGVFMDGKFYVIGGSNTELLNCGEEYNLDTRTWREIPNMCPRRTGPTEAPPLVAVVNNELYAADYAERELMKYNKETISWDTVGRLPERAASMNGWGLAFRACGEQLIVIGGPRAMGGGIIELNSWIPREGPPQWNLLATKQSGNFVYNCAVMGC